MKRLMKQLAAGVLSLSLLLTGCTWGQPEETSAPTTEPSQTETTTPPAGTDCYTYRDWVDAMPVNWNPQEWTQASEEALIALTNPGLYAIYPGTGEGDYILRPEMAAEAPL